MCSLFNGLLSAVTFGWALVFMLITVFFFKQKTADEMRISDWSSDVCSSDLLSGTPNRASTSQSGSPWRTGQHRIKGNRPLGALERLRSHPRLAFREHLSHLRTRSILRLLKESEGRPELIR